MNPLKEVVNNVIQMNSINSHSKEHNCPHCGQLVPKLRINLLGQERVVQPKCDCEVKAFEKDLERLTKAADKREIEKKFALSTLGKRFGEATFENFQQRLGSEKAFELAVKYTKEFDAWEGESILIWGEYGNGKSHLAAAVANELNRKRYIVVFQSVPELLERIRNTFNNSSRETENEIMAALLRCDLLILDDIGAEKLSDWVMDVMFRIIDGRYRRNRPIMYTSNLKPSLLMEKLGGRICDRILETALPVENKASSYRMQKAKERFAKYVE